jgi:type VI secretion system secreted protein Hcp
MALQFYMTAKAENQGDIVGWNPVANHADEMQCHALDQKVYVPFNELDGQPKGTRVHGPITVTKSFDKASPKLMQALCTGENLPEVNLKFFRVNPQGIEEHYYSIVLTNATIVSIRPRMLNVFDDALKKYDHLEDVSFTYGKIEWRWEPDSVSATDEFMA